MITLVMNLTWVNPIFHKEEKTYCKWVLMESVDSTLPNFNFLEPPFII